MMYLIHILKPSNKLLLLNSIITTYFQSNPIHNLQHTITHRYQYLLIIAALFLFHYSSDQGTCYDIVDLSFVCEHKVPTVCTVYAFYLLFVVVCMFFNMFWCVYCLLLWYMSPYVYLSIYCHTYTPLCLTIKQSNLILYLNPPPTVYILNSLTYTKLPIYILPSRIQITIIIYHQLICVIIGFDGIVILFVRFIGYMVVIGIGYSICE